MKAKVTFFLNNIVTKQLISVTKVIDLWRQICKVERYDQQLMKNLKDFNVMDRNLRTIIHLILYCCCCIISDRR